MTFGTTIVLGFHAIVAALFLIATYTDVRAFRIPNWISLVIIVLWVIRIIAEPFLLNTPFHWSVLIDIAPAFLILVIGFALYAVSWFGAGDVKLMTAGALWVGLKDIPFLGGESLSVLVFVLLAMLFGGMLSFAIIIGRRVSKMPVMEKPLAWLDSYRTYMPYAVAITPAMLWVIFEQARALIA